MLCLATIIFEFKSVDVFSNIIFSIVCSSFLSQSRWSLLICVTTLARFFFSMLVESSLKKAGLFNEVKDRLNEPGTSLSGGQQQRLCIARAIAVSPEVILMDEPCSALDPIATAVIEELIDEISKNFTIVIVTHSMQQAARVSNQTAFFHMGNLIEVGKTDEVFSMPKEKKTQDYITGKIG